MRKIDFQKDQQYYDTEHKAQITRGDDPLDLYRFSQLLKLYKRLNRQEPLFKDKSVLNVGGGYGREAYLILSQQPRRVVVSDYSLAQIRESREYLKEFDNKHILCLDGEKIPFKDESFDVCYITEALHHFVHPEKGIAEFIRVSRRMLIIDEPSGGIFRIILNRVFIILGVKEEYERGYLEAFRINRRALKILCAQYNQDLFFYPYFIYYFGWYKNSKNKVLKLLYRNLLVILNTFFHFFGNRAIVIMVPKTASNLA